MTCTGYPAGAPSTSAEEGSIRCQSPGVDSAETRSRSGSADARCPSPLKSWVSDVNEDEGKCIEYAMSILAPNNIDEFGFVRKLITNYIDQKDPICASAKATAAVFGLAVQNVDDGLPIDIQRDLQPASFYEKAVGSIRGELQSKTQADADTIISCILLLCAELVLQRWQKALLHLQTLQTLFYTAISSGTCRQDTSSSDLLFRMFDTQKVMFSTYTRSPAISPIPLEERTEMPEVFTDMNVLDKYVIWTVHSIVCFTSSIIFATCQDKISEELRREYHQQVKAAERCIEIIEVWLKSNDENIKRLHVMRLHNICISTLLELSCIFATTELTWNTYIDKFERVVSQTETILEARRWEAAQVGTSGTHQFSLSLGIIQPIYFTALKCRHPLLRRRAIECLRQAGREGPWYGRVLADVAERCMFMEEAQLAPSLILDSHHTIPITARLLSAIIPEEQRIVDCHLVVSNGEFQGDDDPRNSTMFAPIRQLKFLRRRQADTSIKARMAYSEYVRRSKEKYGFRTMEIDPNRWDAWSEQGPSYQSLFVG